MKIKSHVTGLAVVKIPDGVHLSVPAMGTTPGQMRVSVSGSSVEEVREKLCQFYDAVADAVWNEQS